ncbi:hypothetical protein GDO81_017534 [Engystomops pustulosus]|uniref:Uncharacterized protein n=1 Tax=Engystomops pustulosus TaxID=76066 RepID=A0AAV7A5G1_ENGPU|nr:hypothetical protein GDO81_017534 [Engystomops pustulosus]
MVTTIRGATFYLMGRGEIYILCVPCSDGQTHLCLKGSSKTLPIQRMGYVVENCIRPWCQTFSNQLILAPCLCSGRTVLLRPGLLFI